MCYLNGFLKILKEKKNSKWVLSSIPNWSTIHGRGILYSIPLGGDLYLGAFKIIILGRGGICHVATCARLQMAHEGGL